MFVTHPAYLKQKALQMRVERRLSIDEIALRLALPKTTIYYWLKDVPLGRPRRANRLSGRTWRCEHGVLDVRTGDTMFRARLQG